MSRETEEEYKHAFQRYVKSDLGLWTGESVWFRIVLSPIYAVMMWWYVVSGVDVCLQILQDEDYEPEYEQDREFRRCPQCQQPLGDDLEITVKIQ